MSPDSVVKDSLTTESDGKIFDHHRRATEALEADVTDLQEIEQLEKQVVPGPPRAWLLNTPVSSAPTMPPTP